MTHRGKYRLFQILQIIIFVFSFNLKHGNSSFLNGTTTETFNNSAIYQTKEFVPVSNESKKADDSLIRANPLGTLHEDDEPEQGKFQAWKYKNTVKGYEVLSDDLKFTTELLPKEKFVKISIGIGSARTTEKRLHRRNIDIKIGTWKKVHRLRVIVPFGFQPEELKIVEKPSSIEIFAPYHFIEFTNSNTN